MQKTVRGVTHSIAERHEALWLRLHALHRDVTALASKRSAGKVSTAVRMTAEGLLSDCAWFEGGKPGRLPVAAPDLAGLIVQLGQALAVLDGWESRNTTWDAGRNCQVWQVAGDKLPVRRLRPRSVAPTIDGGRMTPSEGRDKIIKLIGIRHSQGYEQGFAAGRAARIGPPLPGDDPIYPVYPRDDGMD